VAVVERLKPLLFPTLRKDILVSSPFDAAGIPEAAPVEALPEGARVKLTSQRAVKPGVDYPIYDGPNFIGRADELPVDIDLDDQERPDQIWISKQHACVFLEGGQLCVEDLNSSNGSYINRVKLAPNVRMPLKAGDILQIGSVHLKVVVETPEAEAPPAG